MSIRGYLLALQALPKVARAARTSKMPPVFDVLSWRFSIPESKETPKPGERATVAGVTGLETELIRSEFEAELIRSGLGAGVVRLGFEADLIRPGFEAELIRSGFETELIRAGFETE